MSEHPEEEGNKITLVLEQDMVMLLLTTLQIDILRFTDAKGLQCCPWVQNKISDLKNIEDTLHKALSEHV